MSAAWLTLVSPLPFQGGVGVGARVCAPKDVLRLKRSDGIEPPLRSPTPGPPLEREGERA